MKPAPNLGDQEMQILSYVNSHSPISVRDVASHFEKEKNLARTTILTVMERLRKKGYLSRAKENGIFQYSVKVEQEKVLKQKVSDFIEKTLGGSVNPLFSYFLESSKLSDDELRQLKKIADKIGRSETK
jgi:predicted transcriptional regulator